MKIKTREKILNTTLNLIGKEGIDDLTVRKIALSAEVNIASINYYFGSKDKLIAASISQFLQRISINFKILQDESLPHQERFKMLIKGYIDTNNEYPGVIRSIIVKLISGENAFIKKMILPGIKKNFFILIEFMKSYTGKSDREFIMMNIADKMSSVAMPIILGDLFKELLLIDLDNPAVLDRYSRIIIDSKEN